jgi:hypothetical protein
MNRIIFSITAIILFTTNLHYSYAEQSASNVSLSDLKNYHVDTPEMVCSGLPNRAHFEKLRAIGVNKVIDLIPGDRSEELTLMNELNLDYHNIQVEWGNPSIENFREYILTMKQFSKSEGITLTHCRLNWRGAVFTYLYRVTQLKESEEMAKQDMLAIWTPNDTWQVFINNVLEQYN